MSERAWYSNLPNSVPAPVFQRGLFVCEPAISVKRRGYPNQIWSLEKLDNKLVDMRELYNEIQSGNMMQVRGARWRTLEPGGELAGNLNRNSWANLCLNAYYVIVMLYSFDRNIDRAT